MSAVCPSNDLSGLTLVRRGKVRDVYEVDGHLLIVATDRISAFDYVLGSGIPDKGKVLTQLSAFWFDHLGDAVPHHCLSVDVDSFPAADARAPRRAQGPLDAREEDRAAAGRMRRPGISVGLWLEGLRQQQAQFAASRCLRAWLNPTGCQRRSSPRRPRPSRVTTKTSAKRGPAKSSEPSSSDVFAI